METHIPLKLPVGTVYNAWTLAFGADKAVAVAEPDDEDTTYLSSVGAAPRQGLTPANLGATAIATVKHVARARSSIAAQNLQCECWTADEVTGVQAGSLTGYGAAYLTKTSGAVNNPYSGDANWTPSDFDNHMAVMCNAAAGVTFFMTTWYELVDHTPGGGTFAFAIAQWIPFILSLGSHCFSVRDIATILRNFKDQPNRPEEFDYIQGILRRRPVWA